MSKIITWSTPKYSESGIAHETDSLYYADDVIRYWKFRSPFSIKFCLGDVLLYIVGNQPMTVPPGGFYIANDGLEMECLPNNPGVRALIVFLPTVWLATWAGISALAGHLTVSEVALRCGFADVFSFSKTFKREMGIFPSFAMRLPVRFWTTVFNIEHEE